ncbi:hypothetical protein ACTODO_00036 [Schaalia dentiphila ATCC 17982]|uniref:Uncharacterized protein n=1 Tax=Schaalia dentiphila ATCC 17982 TaxID=411466 RepID=A7B8T7_9ACTO|nr:hypothetical protein ACTODO_00036 [Schaalia odontolytica ATCC 17982]
MNSTVMISLLSKHPFVLGFSTINVLLSRLDFGSIEQIGQYL